MTSTKVSSEDSPQAAKAFAGERYGGAKLSDRVAIDMQVRILRGEFEPAQRLPPEADLCEAFGVSRSVVRDALRTLAARGFIEIQQGRGTRISEPNDAAFGLAMLALFMRSDMSMGEVLDARAAVEGQLMPLAAQNRSDEDIVRATERFELFEAAVKDEDWEATPPRHLDFHLELIRAIGVPALPVFLRPLQEIIDLSSRPPRDDDPGLWELDAHRAILDALRDGDPAAMSVAVEQHFEFLKRKPYRAFRKKPVRQAVGADVLKQVLSDATG